MSDLIRRSYILKIIEMWMKVPSYSESERNIMRAIDYEVRTIPSAQQWIPVTERLPEDLKPVNITYINEDPAPYYEHIKGIPFTATAIYYRGGWYWWFCTCVDVLAEYGHSYLASMDEGIEVKAWMPLPEPFKGGGD